MKRQAGGLMKDLIYIFFLFFCVFLQTAHGARYSYVRQPIFNDDSDCSSKVLDGLISPQEEVMKIVPYTLEKKDYTELSSRVETIKELSPPASTGGYDVKCGLIDPNEEITRWSYFCGVPDLFCDLASYLNITCESIGRFPFFHILREHDHEHTLRQISELVSPDAPYSIEPKTHRLWLTSQDSPREVPTSHLAFYSKSLQFYKGKPFVHHFWCNDKTLIPRTIARIQRFKVHVIIHELNEIMDNFIAKDLFKKLFDDGLFSFASDIARQEILIQEGGMYTDIGMEQLRDIEWAFKKYDRVMCISGSWVDNHLIAAKKNSPFYVNSLNLLVPIVKYMLEQKINLSPHDRAMFLTVRLWQLVEAMEGKSTQRESFFYESIDYQWHGLGSWKHLTSRLSLTYLAGE